MRTWTAHTIAPAPPAEILNALTDPDACRQWAPVDFDLEDGTDRLTSGTRTRVSGRLAGVRVGFDVEVHCANERRLALSARGPVHMDVEYDLMPAGGGSEVRASVSVKAGRGLLSLCMAEATAGLLHAGALTTAVARLSRVATAA